MENNFNNVAFFCSWSGGKDSCLALYKGIQNGGVPKKLLTMLKEDGDISRSHGLSIEVLKKQAESLNIPLETTNTTWDDYEDKYIDKIKNYKEEGIEAGVFGDIDLEGHRKWVEKVCKTAQLKPILPLWQKERRQLLKDFLDAGFKTTIVAVRKKRLGKEFLGKELDNDLIYNIEKAGADACGEEGEFHTVVTDGPIFKFPLEIKLKGQEEHNGVIFQNITL